MRTALLLLLALPATARAAERPNVLFIAIDDLNDWVGPLGGHPQAKTPNLDKLAARGTTFTNAHCQSPLCNPSRTSVLTGLRPTTTGVYALAPWFRTAEPFKDHPTVFQAFRGGGYKTLTCGKIFHDAYPPKEQRRNAGPEVDVWGTHGGFTPRPKAKFVTTPDPNPLVDWGAFPAKDDDCYDHDVGTWAVEQLKNPPKGPFFLAVGFRHPHVPCYAPQKWFDLYPDDATLHMPPVKDDDRDDLPRFASYLHWKLPEPRLKWLQEAKQWRPLVRSYLASISYVDWQVGRVLDALAAGGLEKDTIVVLWSDHGWHLGEKGITGKNTLWERSTRVPLIFAGPGVSAGKMCSRPAELLDIYPTLAGLCGLKPNAALEGLSLAPQLRDTRVARRPAVTTHNPNNHAVRTDKWRYIEYADGSKELYDHGTDPNEWANVAAEPKYAAVVRELAGHLPAKSAAPLPGSAGRLLTFENGVPVWEGKPIGKADPFPDK